MLLGWLWLRQTPLSWPILACGLVSLGALIAGGVTGMDVPEPGTLERLMGYPITIGTAAVGLVVAQRVGAGTRRLPVARRTTGRADVPGPGGRLAEDPELADGRPDGGGADARGGIWTDDPGPAAAPPSF